MTWDPLSPGSPEESQGCTWCFLTDWAAVYHKRVLLRSRSWYHLVSDAKDQQKAKQTKHCSLVFKYAEPKTAARLNIVSPMRNKAFHTIRRNLKHFQKTTHQCYSSAFSFIALTRYVWSWKPWLCWRGKVLLCASYRAERIWVVGRSDVFVYTFDLNKPCGSQTCLHVRIIWEPFFKISRLGHTRDPQFLRGGHGLRYWGPTP